MDSTTKRSALTAVIAEALPQRLYRLEIEDGREIIAGPSEDAKRASMSLRPGQRVLVRLTAYDPGRGVILGPAPNH